MYNHAAIPVVDLVEACEFYQPLGLSKFREWKKPTENLEAIVMKKDNLLLELIYSPTNKVGSLPEVIEVRHIGISLQNLPDIISSLQRSGVKILKPITKGVSVKEFAFVADPSGNVVELLVE